MSVVKKNTSIILTPAENDPTTNVIMKKLKPIMTEAKKNLSKVQSMHFRIKLEHSP